MTNALVILRKELRDALRSRWLIAYAVAFTGLAVSLALIEGEGDAMSAQGFNRTTAGLINLCLVLVPVLAVILGADSIAAERDRGTLSTLLAQPISTTELLIGKYVGLSIAVWLAIAMGFGAAGLLIGLTRPVADVGNYALFIALSGALASAMLSIGVLVSVVAKARVRALALAVLMAFGMVLFYDLGAIGLALAISQSGRGLLLTALANPVEAARVLAVMSIEPDLGILGPLGSYLHEELGAARSAILLGGALFAWTVTPLGAALYVLRCQDA